MLRKKMKCRKPSRKSPNSLLNRKLSRKSPNRKTKKKLNRLVVMLLLNSAKIAKKANRLVVMLLLDSAKIAKKSNRLETLQKNSSYSRQTKMKKSMMHVLLHCLNRIAILLLLVKRMLKAKKLVCRNFLNQL
jgi:hypothetical protein